MVVAVTVADRAGLTRVVDRGDLKAYAVEGVRPVTVVEVPVTVRTLAPSR